MTVEVAGERARVQLATWVREGAEVAPPTFSFADEEAGHQARDQAMRALAAGDTAVVRAGATVSFQPPEAIRELVDDSNPLGTGEITVLPADQVLPLRLEIETEDETLVRELDLRPVPPRHSAVVAFAGFDGQVLVEINITLLEKPSMSATLSLSASFDHDARALANARSSGKR